MKKCGRLKARACGDDRKQHSIYTKGDISSPMVQTKSVLLIAAIDAYEGPCVKIANIPGAFLNPKFADGDIVHMRLEGAIADAMVETAPEIYGPYLYRDKNEKSVLIVQSPKVLYGCIKSSMVSGNCLPKAKRRSGLNLTLLIQVL